MRVLITLDAVGGVWRYALDIAQGLQALGVDCILAGFGPEPDAAQRSECAGRTLVWTGKPLDWAVTGPAELNGIAATLAELVRTWNVDLLHLNLPSQAAGLAVEIPVVVTSHSCVPTWWQTVRGTKLPHEWAWQRERNILGFRRANAVIVPSESHGAALRHVYGPLPPLRVVHNGTTMRPGQQPKQPMILGVGRWWDDGKNAETLDAAAALSPWPVCVAGPAGEPVRFRNARVLGSLPHAEVQALMRRAAIFAAPSRYEPFGLAVAEAAMCGAVLVLANIPTFRELWDGSAWFVSPDDTAGWTRAFTELAADHKLRRLLSAAAADRAQRYTLTRQTSVLLDMYTDLVAAEAA